LKSIEKENFVVYLESDENIKGMTSDDKMSEQYKNGAAFYK
jgi:hypothetical protein